MLKKVNSSNNNTRFAIFDIGKSHHDYLEAQTKIFANDKVDFYVSDYLAKYLDNEEKNNSNFKWHVKKEEENNLIFLIKAITSINKGDFDYIIINTIQGQWLCYLILPFFLKKNKKMILSIHNINSYLKLNNNVSIKNRIKYYIKKLNFSKAYAYNVYGQNLKNYLSDKIDTKKIITIPFCVYEQDNNQKNSNNDTFKIVIPGMVDYRRRDYDAVLELMEYLKGSDYQIVFLGRPKGDKGYKLIEKLEGDRNAIVYNQFIPRDVFEFHMKSADVILAPLVAKYEHNDFIEFYGLTKESGASFAAIKYSLPLIIPKSIIVMKELFDSTRQYKDSKELKQIVDFLMNKKNQGSERNKANRNSMKFNSKKIRELIEFQLK